MDKASIIGCLEEIAVLLELKGENPFKFRAYENGARALETLEENFETLIDEKRLTDVSGIGAALAEKIETLYKTGKLDYYDKLKASVPAGVLEMLEVPGLGAKKVRVFYEKLKITSLEELKEACEAGKIAELPGFGAKSQDNILSGINHLEAYRKRYMWATVEPQVEAVLTGLRALPEVELAECAGSFRRKLETVGDLDFLVASEAPEPVMDWFTRMPEVEKVTGHGTTKSSVRLEGGLQMDLRVVPKAQFFFALHHFTGSKEHNVKMRQRALSQGFSLSEWGVKAVHEDHPAPIQEVDSEEELFQLFGLHYIPPELREGVGEVDYASHDALPKLVKPEDIRGVFHNHTTASDGKNTLEAMVAEAERLGFEYLGIADHSKSSFQANGLSEEKLLEQLKAIRKLNASKQYKTHVFAGVECDILKDGSLDYEDAVLEELDYVVASVHNALTLDEAAMTRRIIRALEHPCTTMLGHLSGRLLLKREAYTVNIPKVIDAAIANKKIIELNASPKRLDMDWRYWHKAADRGLLCSINPDAHSIEQLKNYRYGVYCARKGWLQKCSVFNARPLKEVSAFLRG
tara:strand:- start:9272 stop:10999 length:1728 start_codon:yes stop_codon:yes gene_type:complete